MRTKIGSTFAMMTAVGLLVAGIASAQPNMRAQRQERRQDRQEERQDDRRDAVTEDMTGWTKLGERWVNGAMDRDEIVVGVVEGTFRRVMLKVEHSRLDLINFTLHFGDGSSFSPGTRLSFVPGTTSRVIDLPGAARVIRRAEFQYANLPGGGRAQIELWAR